MNIELSPEQKKYKEEFKKYVDEYVVPYAAKNDKEEKIDEAVVNSMKERGYLGAMVPKKYNGMGLDNVTLGILTEELGRGCSGVRNLITVHGMVSIAILRWGTKKQKEEILPRLANGSLIGAFGLTEPEIGSDAKNINTTAVDEGDDIVLNGQKKWITMGQIADIFLIFAKYNGKLTAFLIKNGTKGFSQEPLKGLMGARASMTALITMKNCRVCKEDIVGNVGMGLSQVALYCLDYGRYTVAWGCIGLAQACIEDSLKYAHERKQFERTLDSHQLVQKMITEMVTTTKAARLMCYYAGYLKDVFDPDSIMETWNAKYFASTMVNKVASNAVQILGGNGLTDSYPVERYYRDARVNEIIEGTTQVHEMLIARNVTN